LIRENQNGHAQLPKSSEHRWSSRIAPRGRSHDQHPFAGRQREPTPEREGAVLALGHPVSAAATQVNKLRTLAVLGRYDEALECGRQARDVFLAHNDLLAAHGLTTETVLAGLR